MLGWYEVSVTSGRRELGFQIAAGTFQLSRLLYGNKSRAPRKSGGHHYQKKMWILTFEWTCGDLPLSAFARS